ncbi:hypothetical protein [Roseococcus sp.]|uniref:hypothetical protein n=1 Tax=Roseococcus sp. TaxID=2109646 RepID=UPI003BA96A14
MRIPTLLALLACIGCSDLKPLPLVDSSAAIDAPRQSAMRQTIRAQLNSQATERPPTPVPGSEAEGLATLQALPNLNSATSRGGRSP